MKSQVEIVSEMITIVEQIRIRPRMFFGDMLPAPINFLNGVGLMLVLMDLSGLYYHHYWEIAKQRGWRSTSQHIHDQMIEKGLTQEEATAELMEIELEVWKRMLKDVQNPDL
jgi:hypothetical protein